MPQEPAPACKPVSAVEFRRLVDQVDLAAAVADQLCAAGNPGIPTEQACWTRDFDLRFSARLEG